MKLKDAPWKELGQTQECIKNRDITLSTKVHTVKAVVFSVVRYRCESKSRSVVSDSLRPQGLYSPWNSPGQNTGVGSLSLLQGIFPTQGSNSGLLHCRWILYQVSYEGNRPQNWPFSVPTPPGSVALQGWPKLLSMGNSETQYPVQNFIHFHRSFWGILNGKKHFLKLARWPTVSGTFF